jgi:hypothetical protein
MYKLLSFLLLTTLLIGCSNSHQTSEALNDDAETVSTKFEDHEKKTDSQEVNGPENFTVKFSEPFIYDSLMGPKLEIFVDYVMYSDNMASGPYSQDFVPTDELRRNAEEYDSKYKYAEIYLRVKNIDEDEESLSLTYLHDEYSFNFYDDSGNLIDADSIDRLPYENYYSKYLSPGEENEGSIFIALPKDSNPTQLSYFPIPTGDEYFFDMDSLNMAN